METKRAETRRARRLYKMENITRPSGCIVPSLKMISISNCFRLKQAPEHFLRPLTAMSDRLCPGELKCSATGKPAVFFWTLRRCSPNRSRRVRPVSPMYSWGHRRHEMQYTTFSDLQVKRSRMVVELLGPHTWTLDVVQRQVRQRGCRHANVPGTFVWDLSEVCTRMSRRLRSRRCATTGGAGKIVAVTGSLVRILKLLSKMCLTRELKGWYVRTRGILSSFSRTCFSSASWRVTEDTLSRAFCSKSEG